MPWDRTLPANSSKIRLSAGYIRSNWDAIEFGDVPYDKLQLQEQAANPTQTADTGWLYTKDSATITELFYMDDQATPEVIQLTSGGKIGSSGRDLIGARLFFGSTTFQNTQANMVNAHGRFTDAGGLIAAFNVNCTRVAAGRYDITFIIPMTGTYSISATCDRDAGDHNRIANYENVTVNGFRVTTRRGPDSGTFVDCPFSVACFGGR